MSNWEVNRILVFVAGILAILGLVLNSNLKLRFGDKELVLGKGAKRLDDIALKESLNSAIRDIDARKQAKLYRCAKNVKHGVQTLLSDHHCPFTLYTAGDFLEDSINTLLRSDFVLSVKEGSSPSYFVQNLMTDYESVYERTVRDAFNAPCHDETFPSWGVVKADIGDLLFAVFKEMFEVIKSAAEKKLEVYEEYRSRFSEKAFVEQAVQPFIVKNKRYIEVIDAHIKELGEKYGG
jgi:hypothetical protein